jgi:hypothetical protein
LAWRAGSDLNKIKTHSLNSVAYYMILSSQNTHTKSIQRFEKHASKPSYNFYTTILNILLPQRLITAVKAVNAIIMDECSAVIKVNLLINQ